MVLCVSTAGLDGQMVRQYIKNQKDRYDMDLFKNPFRGASSILRKEDVLE
jgi:hypothetical protein